MTTVDLTLEELCTAIYYVAAFELTWAAHKNRINTERARRRWLQQHMIDRERMARG